MPAKKKRREEWIDPRAPTELTGELAAVCGDMEELIRDRLEDLSLLGVRAVFNNEWGGYEFSGRDQDGTKIARYAYEVGFCLMQLKSVRGELDLLLSKQGGILRSAESRTITKQRRDAEFLQAYATLMEEEGRVEIKTLAKERGVGKSAAYSILQNLNEFLEEEARRLRRQQPRLPRRAVIDTLLEKHGSRPGVNRQTIEKAISRLK